MRTQDGLEPGSSRPRSGSACAAAWPTRPASGPTSASSPTLGSEGRSTATTILSLSVVRGLRGRRVLEAKARKLLSFTDNRQDASLQAGHFNDFVAGRPAALGALHGAPNAAGTNGLTHEELAQRVFDALALPVRVLRRGSGRSKFAAKDETDRALRDVIGYRLYRDLQRGWRITSPNLEQCGLLRIDYRSLDELCAAEDELAAAPIRRSRSAVAGRRASAIAKVLLDYMRRELAIKVDYLDEHGTRSRLQQQSSSSGSIAPWAIDEDERLETRHGAVPAFRASRATTEGSRTCRP